MLTDQRHNAGCQMNLLYCQFTTSDQRYVDSVFWIRCDDGCDAMQGVVRCSGVLGMLEVLGGVTGVVALLGLLCWECWEYGEC